MTLNVGDRIRILAPRVGQWFRIESLSESFVGIESGPLTRRLVEKGIENSTIQHASNAGAKVYADLDEAKSAMGAGEVVARLAPLARWIVVPEGQFEASADTCGWEMEAQSYVSELRQTDSFVLAAAVQAMFDMGFGPLVMRESAS